MGTITTTITKSGANKAFGTADMRERIVYAFGTSDDRIAERVALVTVWRDAGFSVRGIVAGVTVAFGGDTPDGFSSAQVGRALVVANLINGTDTDDDGNVVRPLAKVTDDGDYAAVVAGLVNVAAKHGKAVAVSTLAKYLAARTHAAGLAIITKQGKNAKAVTDALAGASRAPQVAAETETAETVGETAETAETAPVGTNGTPGLMSFSTARLVTELTRRGATEWNQAALDAFETLALHVESVHVARDAVESTRV